MEMQDNMPASPKEQLRALRILNSALVIGAALFTVIAVTVTLINGKGAFSISDTKKTGVVFLVLSVFLAVFCFYRAITVYKRRMEEIRNGNESLLFKLNQYHSALILYLAPCEGAAIFSVIVFFLTGDYKALIVTALMVAAMVIKMPARKKMREELGLNWNEEQEFY